MIMDYKIVKTLLEKDRSITDKKSRDAIRRYFFHIYVCSDHAVFMDLYR